MKNKLIENIKNSEEYQKLKPYEGNLVKQWRLTTSLIITLTGMVILFTFIYLYANTAKNLEIIFLILLLTGGAIIIIFGSLYCYYFLRNRHITREIKTLIDPIFWMKFIQEAIDETGYKGVKITSITARPEIPLSLDNFNKKINTETFINGTYNNIAFSFGSVTALSETPLYGNATFTSLEKSWSSYYRYAVLSFKLPNKLKKSEIWNLNFKTQPKFDYLKMDDVFHASQINKLSEKTKIKILKLISKTRFIPQIKITNNIQTLVGRIYHITNLSDNRGLINHVEINNSYTLIQNIYDCLQRDVTALTEALEWILDYTV